MAHRHYQRGDWLRGTVIEENEDDILVIQNVYPDGYTYTFGEPDLDSMSHSHDSRTTTDPYLLEGWELLPRVEDMTFKEADWILPANEESYIPRLILSVRPTGYTWLYLGSTREYYSEDSSNPYFVNWIKYPGQQGEATEMLHPQSAAMSSYFAKINEDLEDTKSN